ncbi:MAG TPA: extracellular solute-binding protein [Peptococcaceae bacterium]|nr:extracellular solute-binding protein [Peptococcaceae bacterium]
MKNRIIVKKIIVYSLGLCLFFSLLNGCGQEPKRGTPGGVAPDVISVWYSLMGETEKELLRQFERISQEYPEVIVKGEYIPEGKFLEQVWTLQAGGEGPEIFITSRSVIAALYEKGAISPVLADNYSAYPAAEAVFTYNQQPFAVPLLTDVPLLYYRQDKVPVPPASLAEIIAKKQPIAVKALDLDLLCSWWKAEGGSLTLAGKPALNSANNVAFLTKLLSLRAERLLTFDQAIPRFNQGEVNYLLAWASDSAALDKAGVSWGCLALNSLLFNGKALPVQTIGIANSSIKTIPALEESIKLVEEELLKVETQTSLHKASGKMPALESYYQEAGGDSIKAQTAVSLKNAWYLEGYSLEWELFPMLNQAWQNAAGGAKIEGELANAQQQALLLADEKREKH